MIDSKYKNLIKTEENLEEKGKEEKKESLEKPEEQSKGEETKYEEIMQEQTDTGKQNEFDNEFVEENQDEYNENVN